MPESTRRIRGPHGEFAHLLRKFRTSKGLRSAAALAKLAGVSRSYLAVLERGESKPQTETVVRIAAALDLDRSQRGELLAAATLTGQSEDVATSLRDGLVGPPLAGQSVWVHFPQRLFAVPHTIRRSIAESPDGLLASIVPAAAALLTWARFEKATTPAALRKRVRDQVIDLADNIELSPRSNDFALGVNGVATAADAAALFIPQVWRDQLFTSPSGVSFLLRDVERWEYQGGYADAWPPLLSIGFSPAQRDLSVVRVTPDDVSLVHDLMTTFFWWSNLGLDERYSLRAPPLRPEPVLLSKHLRTIHAADLGALPAQLVIHGPATKHLGRPFRALNSPLAFELWSAMRCVRLLARVESISPLVAAFAAHAQIADLSFPSLLVKCDQLEQLVKDADREATGRSASRTFNAY